MAEFLLHAQGRVDTKTGLSSWDKWAIVEVYPDGRCTEPPSPSSLFVIVKIPGLSLKAGQNYMQPYMALFVAADGHPIMINRRLYEIDITLIPESLKTTMFINKIVTIPLNEIKSFIRNKETGAYEG